MSCGCTVDNTKGLTIVLVCCVTQAYSELCLLDAYIEIAMQTFAAEVFRPVRVLIIQHQQREVSVLVKGGRTLSGTLNRSSCVW